MAKFKMDNAPYKKEVTPVYEVPFDNPGLVAKANDNQTIIVNKDLVKDKELMDEAMSHEKKHLKDMQDGILSYDSDSVTYKGKKYDRGSFNEGNDKLPWEAPAYKAGKERKEFDLTPNPNKLDGPPSFSPMAFDKIGGKSGRRDEDEVNMSESFGSFMMKKKWGGPAVSGGSEEDKKKADKSSTEEDKEVEMGEWGPWEQDPENPEKEVRYRKGQKKTSENAQFRVKAAIAGGIAGKEWEETIIKMLEAGASFEDIAKEGHGTVAGLKAKFEGKFTPPSAKTEEKIEVQQRSKPKQQSFGIGTDLFEKYFSQFSRKKIYDSATEKMRPMTEAEILREAPGPLVQQYRDAIAEANLKGDEDQIVNVVSNTDNEADKRSKGVNMFKKVPHLVNKVKAKING